MPLSEDEQNSLDQIETCCPAEDPGFADRLDMVVAHSSLRHQIKVAGYGFWFGLVLLMAGAAGGAFTDVHLVLVDRSPHGHLGRVRSTGRVQDDSMR